MAEVWESVVLLQLPPVCMRMFLGVPGWVAAEYCRAFCSVPRPLQTVQKTELWGGAFVVIQAVEAVHGSRQSSC